MWELPGLGLEPMSPALAGGFLTTAPPGKSQSECLKNHNGDKCNISVRCEQRRELGVGYTETSNLHNFSVKLFTKFLNLFFKKVFPPPQNTYKITVTK